MNLKIQFHDSVIESVDINNDSLILKFRYFVVFEVYDVFGFKCSKRIPGYSGTIIVKSPSLDHSDFKKWPIPCDIYDGYILIEDARYNLVSLQLNIQKSCAFFIESNGEKYLIFGKGLEIDAHK